MSNVSGANAQSVAATISQSTGPVTVERYGETIELVAGDVIYASDTITTGNHSVQLNFIDGSSANLSPQSVMSVQEFSFGQSNVNDSYVLNLAAGVMQAVSGAVVEQNPDAFKIITPKATAGIRGTTLLVSVNDDGSQEFVLQAIDQGHNLVITTYGGNQVSLTTANAGAQIPAGTSLDITPTTFTPQQVEQLVQKIVAALESDTPTESDGTTQTTLLLESEVVASVSTATLGELVSELVEVGISVGFEDSTGALGESIIETVLAPSDGDGSEDAPNLLVSVSIDGGESYIADEIQAITGQTYIAVSQDITITENITNTSIHISGDIASIGQGTLYAGNDNISGKDMLGGLVAGDSLNAGGDANLICGNDTISFANKDGGNSIYGDVRTVDGGQIQCGNDSIVITGTFSQSTIAGDIGVLNGGTITWGNDTITIYGDVGGGPNESNIYGDKTNEDVYAVSEGGNDSITLHADLHSIAAIYGGGGNDTITVLGTMGESTNSAPAIIAGAGDDVIRVAKFEEGNILTGQGNDLVEITVIEATNDRSIFTDEGSDTLSLKAEGNAKVQVKDFDVSNDVFIFNGTTITNDTMVTVGGTQKTFAEAATNLNTVTFTAGSDILTVYFQNS